jgi:hypothetical protein
LAIAALRVAGSGFRVQGSKVQGFEVRNKKVSGVRCQVSGFRKDEVTEKNSQIE